MLGFIAPLAQDNQTGSNPLSLLLFLGLMFVVFYFLMIRPQQKRARAQRELLQGLEVGDEVLTVSGMFGTIRTMEDDEVTVELGPGIEIRMVKSAIARKLVFDEGQDETDVDEEEQAGEQT